MIAMKLVFLSCPTANAGDLKKARALFSEIKKREEVMPMIPYLIAAEVHRIDLEARSASRALISEHSLTTMSPEELWVFGEPSPEMQKEIEFAKRLAIPVVYRPAQ